MKRRACIGKCPRQRPRSGLGKLAWNAPTRTATITIGQNKGEQERSRSGSCASAPSAYDAAKIDREFERLRAAQVGRGNVAATRVQNRGWYQGKPEASLAYQVIHTGDRGEKSWSSFERRMKNIAETLAKRVCQDEVLVTFDKGDGPRQTYSFTSEDVPEKASPKRR